MISPNKDIDLITFAGIVGFIGALWLFNLWLKQHYPRNPNAVPLEEILEKGNLDTPVLYQTGFQDPVTSMIEGIFLFNLHLISLNICIIVVVAWSLYAVLINFVELNQSYVSMFVHSNEVELVWTKVPAAVLFSLASPSFALLYSLDEISNPALTFKISGHQWYWSYATSDFNSCLENKKTLKYSSYMLNDNSLKNDSNMGLFRNFVTNKVFILPTVSHLRFLITAVDVLHSWTIPSFGVKIDACPGRLNHLTLFLKRFGVFFGQCSEMCGVNHGFMPISVLALNSVLYYCYLTKEFASVADLVPVIQENSCIDVKTYIDKVKSDTVSENDIVRLCNCITNSFKNKK